MAALLVAFCATLRAGVRSRVELELELEALRHQLAVLQRDRPRRRRLCRTDRLVWVLLSRVWPQCTRSPSEGTIAEIPHLGGLHHHYERRAA